MEEELLMEELRTPPLDIINQNYVTITTRAKGPPSITVKAVNKSARLAYEEARDLFDEGTRYYKEKFDAEQAPKIAAEDRIDPDEDTSEE